MRKSSNGKRSKLSLILWIIGLIIAEAILVLWPLNVILLREGFLSSGVMYAITFGLVAGLIFGLFSGFVNSFVSGLTASLAFGLIAGFAAGFVAGLIAGLAFGIAVGIGFGTVGPEKVYDDELAIGPGIGLVVSFGVGLVAGIIVSFIAGLAAGLVAGIIIGIIFGLLLVLVATGLVDDLTYGLFVSLGFGLSFGLVIGLVIGLFVGLDVGLGFGFGVSVSTSVGVLLFHGLKELSAGGLESVKQFLTPWRSRQLYFGRSVGFFALIYIVFTILFSLWFCALYVNATVELPTMNPYFETQDIVGKSNFWTFTYFSFITIASLGYGDVYPTHWFSQILVILETMVGVGLIAGFLAMIITVGGRSKRRIEEIDFDSDIDY